MPRAPVHSGSPDTAPLPDAQRARGRRLAIASHPAGMTFYMVYTQQLPTLALVHLGASETAVGLQNGFMFAFQLLQLPTLRAVARFAKRHILIAGQALAALAALPLVLFGPLSESASAVPIALASFALVAVGLNVSQTVWFPLLRGFVEPDAIGRFFGVLRTGWHLALIVYYLGAQAWLVAHPGRFGPLFLVGWLCGVARVALIARLPERNERTGAAIRAREALALLRENALLRRYLLGVTWAQAVRLSVLPFAIVMLRREVGFSDGDLLLTTVAWFGGGLVSLYLWGRAVDRAGAAPTFIGTSLGMGAVTLLLLVVEQPGPGALALMVAYFFVLSALWAGFGVADTHVLFRLTPDDAPARTIVVAQVTANVLASLAPVAVGFALDRSLAATDDALSVYRAFFSAAAALQALAFLPLRRFRG